MRETTNGTVRIAGISGSLRRASFSTALLKILAEKALPAIEIQVVTLENIPLYNEDLDRKPEIPAVAAFKRIIAESDGVLIATPEYNHGIPGVLKNALDWASRPSSNPALYTSQYRLSVRLWLLQVECARSISYGRL
jgi:chromate reductase